MTSSLNSNTTDSIRALVLCAGGGTRMKSGIPKVMHKIGGLPLIGHVLETLKMLPLSHKACVISSQMDEVKGFVSPIECYIQSEAKGTAHAVLAAAPFFESAPAGCLLVLFGDTPLITPETIKRLLNKHKASKAALTILGMEVPSANQYGRIFLDKDGFCTRIIEAKEATEAELKNTLCNSGVMILDLSVASSLLREVTCHNASEEYYLTDCVEIAAQKGLKTSVALASQEEVFGINTQADLAVAEEVFQKRARLKALEQGVSLQDPASVYFSYDTSLEKGVFVEPHVYFGPNVRVEEGARIRAFSYLEGAKIGKNSIIGPFARLRPGTEIFENVRVGNFVEIKKSVLSKDVKVNHLSYIGDAEIGASTNIGAGTITCNYDGISKHETKIGEKVFIGSNTALIAPISIGEGAIIGAGSVITQDVADDAIALSRSPQKQILEGAKRFQQRARKIRKG
ncbi:MAG: bifunctional UDP-N-acetylglucosamine diphosphorylase/glucosamine-1-phosphate N-acetyltransferase GlmU [Proteobacteria bacterium]|nr:bifunctional UDP-N-acetylglucosamine diphosphorylase/glucosamine-1-phosphate N-acetyltransferase GlmU [Pseudomonadota bacterium]